MKKHWSTRALALLLVISLITAIAEQVATSVDTTVSVYASGDAADGGDGQYITYTGSVDLGTNGNAPVTQEEPEEQPSPEAIRAYEEAAERLYGGGMIHIFNFRQLQLAGSGAELKTGDDVEETVGSGAQITDQNGEPVTYAADAVYYLEGDISLPAQTQWNVPAGFSGEFTSARKMEENAGKTEETDDGDNSGDGAGDRRVALPLALYDALRGNRGDALSGTLEGHRFAAADRLDIQGVLFLHPQHDLGCVGRVLLFGRIARRRIGAHDVR